MKAMLHSSMVWRTTLAPRPRPTLYAAGGSNAGSCLKASSPMPSAGRHTDQYDVEGYILDFVKVGVNKMKLNRDQMKQKKRELTQPLLDKSFRQGNARIKLTASAFLVSIVGLSNRSNNHSSHRQSLIQKLVRFVKIITKALYTWQVFFFLVLLLLLLLLSKRIPIQKKKKTNLQISR